jgi:hypothetical protein
MTDQSGRGSFSATVGIVARYGCSSLMGGSQFLETITQSVVLPESFWATQVCHRDFEIIL